MEMVAHDRPLDRGNKATCKFYRADTGEVHELDILTSWRFVPINSITPCLYLLASSISVVKESLSNISNINPADQILLCDKVKLEDERNLRHYNLPSADKPIFLFNRRSLQPNAPQPQETVLGPIELKG